MNQTLRERVQEALDRAGTLPAEEQERVAIAIRSLIENALWDAQLHDPANQEAHAALIAEALAEGDLQPFPTADELGVDEPAPDDIPRPRNGASKADHA